MRPSVQQKPNGPQRAATLTVAIDGFSDLLHRGISAIVEDAVGLEQVPMPGAEDRDWPNVVILDGDYDRQVAVDALQMQILPGSVGFVVLANSTAKLRAIHARNRHVLCLAKEPTSSALLVATVYEAARSGLIATTRTSTAHAAIPITTPRENAILTLILTGLTQREIAEELGISTETVRTHSAHLRKKFKVRSTRELIVAANRAQ